MALADRPAGRLLSGTLGCTVLCLVLLFAGKASASPCPSEALRFELGSAQLPDCRAYELVSPAAKNGWGVEVSGISSNGLNMLATSLGGFAGSDQPTPESAYEFSRTIAGWKTTPVAAPPAGLSDLVFANLVSASSDLTDGLFRYRPASAANLSEGSIYLRGLPGAPAVEVGPMFSPAVLASNPPGNGEAISAPSASGDLSHVYFTIPGATSNNNGSTHYLWPGDKTVGNTGPLYGSQGFTSLYSYTGTGKTEPKLVGVRNEGALSSNAEAQLISMCGTSLGFPTEGGNFSSLEGGELYNAISADGSRVFFTVAGATQGPSNRACTEAGAGSGPPADELFARTDESQTTAISEPSERDCSLCDTSEPDVREAVFQGASEDGSKVFFLSEQHMLAGAEGENLYEYDFAAEAGQRVVLVAANMQEVAPSGQLQGVARVSEDGSRVYFVAKSVLPSEPDRSLALGRQEPEAGADNLYVYDTATKRTAFVGALSAEDTRDWQQEDSRLVDATPDGRFLVFASLADLTPGDTSSARQVFEYDAEAGSLVRVSIGQGGFNNNGNTGEYAANIVPGNYRGSVDPGFHPSSVSDDGAYVALGSRDNLTPQAARGYGNVYEYHDGRVSLISDGEDRTSSTVLAGIDGSGTDLFFTSADRLVPQDGDTQEDVYDARIDGGFPPPAGRSACEGAGCQGPLAPTPPFTDIGSASQPAGERVLAPTAPPVVKPKAKAPKKKAKKAKRRGRAKAGSRHPGARKPAAKKSAKGRS